MVLTSAVTALPACSTADGDGGGGLAVNPPELPGFLESKTNKQKKEKQVVSIKTWTWTLRSV